MLVNVSRRRQIGTFGEAPAPDLPSAAPAWTPIGNRERFNASH